MLSRKNPKDATINPDDYGPMHSLNKCIEQISDWMCQNFLQLNKDETEMIIFGAKKEQTNVSAHLEARMFKTSNHVRNLSGLRPKFQNPHQQDYKISLLPPQKYSST